VVFQILGLQLKVTGKRWKGFKGCSTRATPKIQLLKNEKKEIASFHRD
jgi:hypothetical protein